METFEVWIWGKDQEGNHFLTTITLTLEQLELDRKTRKMA